MPATFPPVERPQLIAVSAAASHLDVSPRTIRRRIEDGTLPAYRVGRLLKIDPADLDRIAQPIVSSGDGDAR